MTNGRRSAFGMLGVAAIVALAGCASNSAVVESPEPYVPRAVQQPAEWTPGDRPVTRALTMSTRTAESARLVSQQKMQSEWEPAGASGGSRAAWASS